VTPSVFIVAVEASGDAIGSDLIDALRADTPDVRIEGVGGAGMTARGASSPIDLSGLAVLGLVDGLKAISRVKKAVQEVADTVMRANPDAVVLVDAWGFMWRLARELKLRKSRARLIKLVGPQVWATRPGRARVLAQWTDHLVCINEFEAPFYKPYGLKTTVMGNPAIGRLRQGDAAAFRQKHGLAPEVAVVGLLPGSRASELSRVAPTLAEACRIVCQSHDDRHVVCIVAGAMRERIMAMAKTWAFPLTLIDEDEGKSDAMAAMDVAIACSGTVTTEVAEQGAALVVGYKLGWITWAIARALLMKSRFITLLNVAADREIAPEFVQTRFSPVSVARAAERLLENVDLRKTQIADQYDALARMTPAKEGATVIAARAILQDVADAAKR
jgi:lipid-A-disaccharide synthase